MLLITMADSFVELIIGPHLYSFLTAAEFPTTSSELRGRYFSVQGTSSSCLARPSSWRDSSTAAFCTCGCFLLSLFLLIAPCRELTRPSDLFTVSDLSWLVCWRLRRHPSLWDSTSCFLFPETGTTGALLFSPEGNWETWFKNQKQLRSRFALYLIFSLKVIISYKLTESLQQRLEQAPDRKVWVLIMDLLQKFLSGVSIFKKLSRAPKLMREQNIRKLHVWWHHTTVLSNSAL